MTGPYSPDFLASLGDGELAAHLFDAICAHGENGDETLPLRAEAERRGLTDKQISAAFFTGSATA